MLRLTVNVEYAFFALRQLAADYGRGGNTKLSDLVGSELSEKYMLQVLADLRRAGLVESRRGKHGGFSLSRAPSSITIADLMEATGAFSGSRLEIAGDESLLAHWWAESLAQLRESGRTHTLETAADELAPALMYYI